MAANCAKKINIPSLRSNSFPFFQAKCCSLASLICEGCGLRDQRTIEKPKQVLQLEDFHTCETLSSCQNWSQKQSKNFLGGRGMPPDLPPPQAVACLRTRTANLTTPNVTATALHTCLQLTQPYKLVETTQSFLQCTTCGCRGKHGVVHYYLL